MRHSTSRAAPPHRRPATLVLFAAISIFAPALDAATAAAEGRVAPARAGTAGEADGPRPGGGDFATGLAPGGDGGKRDPSCAGDHDSVSIRDESGRPIPGARVSFWAREGFVTTPIETRITDGDGLARLEDVPRGAALRSVGAAGFVPRVDEPGELGRDALTLSRGRAVTLRVVNARDTLPVRVYDVLVVPDAVERASPAEIGPLIDGLVPVRIRSDGGAAVVSGVPAGPATAIVTAAGFAPATVRVDPAAGEIVAGLDSRGCRGVEVLDAETGLPVSGARAAASPELLTGPLARIAAVAQSDESGVITACGGGRLLIAHEDYAPTWIDAGGDGLDAGNGPARALLDRGGSIEGRVHDDVGLPLEGVVVHTRAAGLERTSVSDATGRFAFERVAAGALVLEAQLPASARDDGAGRTLRRTVPVERGETSRVLLSPLPGYALRLSGDVQPGRGSTALLLGRSDGGRLDVVAAADLGVDGTAQLPIPDDERDVHSVALRGSRDIIFAPVSALDIADDERLAQWEIPGWRVTGTVVDRRTARGVAGASIVCMQRGVLHVSRGDDALSFPPDRVRLSVTGRASAAVTDERGRFSLLVPTWCRKARVLGPRTSSTEPPWAELVADAGVWSAGEPVRLELERGPLVLVELELAGTVPGGVVEVALRRPGEAMDRLVTAAVAGNARLAPPGEGLWDVVARAPGLAPAVERVEAVAAAAPAETVLRLSPGGHLLIERAGHRAGSGGLKILDQRGLDWTTLVELVPLSADTPLIEAGPLPPGRYTIADGELRASARLRFDGDVRRVRLRR